MSFPGSIELENRALINQESANALSDMRSNVAPVIGAYILANPDYHSWALAGLVTALHITDKWDGHLAKTRERLLARAVEIDPAYLPSDELHDAVAIGGEKDQKADKRLNHTLFFAIAGREALNGNKGYASMMAGLDSMMIGRDTVVNRAREHAANEGKNGDARKLGKWKQLALAVTQIVAVSPLARPSKSVGGWSFGRIVVATGMAAGTVMSGISGFDQLKSLSAQSSEPLPDTPRA